MFKFNAKVLISIDFVPFFQNILAHKKSPIFKKSITSGQAHRHEKEKDLNHFQIARIGELYPLVGLKTRLLTFINLHILLEPISF